MSRRAEGGAAEAVQRQGDTVLEMDPRAVPSRRKAGRAGPSELLLLLRGLGTHLGRGGPPGL